MKNDAENENSRVVYLKSMTINPIALKKAKIVYTFGLSECNRDK